MQKRVLVANPWIYDFTAYDLWMKPLGLLFIASHLKKLGFEVELLDCLDRNHSGMPEVSNKGPKRLREFGCGGYHKEILPRPDPLKGIPRHFGRFGIPLSEVKKDLSQRKPFDIALITCGMTYWYPGAVFLREVIKEIWPSCQVVLGGIYPSLCPKHSKQWGFDAVISSIGPVQALEEISIVLGKNPQICTVEEFLSVSPLYSLYERLSYGVILTSVGCPFRCNYCASGTLWPSFSRRNPTLVIEEIKTLYHSFRVKDFAFYDDALLFRAQDGFLQLLEGIIKLDLPLRFHLPNGIHARFLKPKIARMMYRANFKTLRIALETASPEIQRATGNKVDNRTFENAVASLQEAGFSPQEIEVYLLFGFPGSSPEDYLSSVEYVKKMGLRPRIALYSPVPGSADFEKLIKVYPEIKNEPLLHNKIAYLYYSGQNELYAELQKLCSEPL